MFKVIILYIILCLLPLEAMSNNSVSELLWKQKKANEYIEYTPDELRMLEGVFLSVLSGKITPDVKNDFYKLNFKLFEDKDFIVLFEHAPPYKGSGVYIINKNAENNVLLQSPHAFYDMKTAAISHKVMLENSIKALSISTVHRRLADITHLDNTAFLSFTRAFINTYNDGNVVQIHGFNESARMQTRNVDFILSNGTVSRYRSLLSQSECLSRKLRSNAKIYPLNISVLGGTRNKIGKMLRSKGFNAFKHIEISYKMRQILNRSLKSRRIFSQCIIK